jgi:hypothetical protein
MLTSAPAPFYDRFAFKPERFLGDTLTCAESSKLVDPMDRDHWAFGAGYVVQKRLSLLAFSQQAKTCLRWLTLFIYLFVYSNARDAAAAFVPQSTSQSTSCGSRSRGCFGRMTSGRHPTSPFRWRDTAASLRARRSRIVSPSHRDIIACRRCLRRKRK